MKFFVAAFVVAASAHKLHHSKADLPYTLDADKIDPLSRYVNDEDVVQLRDDINLVQT